MSIKRICFLILNTLIVFGPNLRFLPKWTWLVAGLGMLCMFDKRVSGKMGYTSKRFITVIILMILVTVASICVPVFYLTYDFTYTPILIGLILSTLRGVFLSCIFYKLFREDATIEFYIEFFTKSCVIYFAFTLLFIIAPEFKEFWMNSVIIPVEGSDYIAYKYRYSLDGFAAFSAATIFSLAVLLNTYLIVINRGKRSKFYFNVLTYILICMGCFFYGRISIFAIAISFVYMFLFYGRKKRIGMLFAYLAIVSVILIISLMKLAESNPDIKIWTNWAFEFIINLFKGDIGESYSVSHMFEDMYFLPSLKTILVGDGRYKAINGNGYYMSTDVGFIRPLLFFGIIGLSVNYSMLILILKKMYYYFSQLRNKSGKLLIVAISLLTVVLEMKGEAFHRILYCIIPIYFIQYYNVRKQVISNKVENQ